MQQSNTYNNEEIQHHVLNCSKARILHDIFL